MHTGVQNGLLCTQEYRAHLILGVVEAFSILFGILITLLTSVLTTTMTFDIVIHFWNCRKPKFYHRTCAKW